MKLLIIIACLICVLLHDSHAAEPNSDPILRVETGMHTAAINRLAIDASGRYLATASDDKTVRVWDMSDVEATGSVTQSGRNEGKGRLQESPLRLVRTLRPPISEGNEGKIIAVAMTPNGETIACGGWTGLSFEGKASVYIFDRVSGEMKHRISGLPEVIRGLAYSPDGRFLAIALGGGKGIVILAADTNRPVARDLEYEGDVTGLTFSTDGRLATLSRDGTTRLYDNKFRLKLKRKIVAIGQSGEIAFTPDGTRLVTGTSVDGQGSVLLASDLSPDADRHTAHVGRTAQITAAWFNGDTARFRTSVDTASLRVNGDGTIVTLSNGGSSQLAFSLTERQFIPFSNISSIHNAAPDKATGLTVTCNDDGTLRWYRLIDGKELLALFLHRDGKRWVAWTPSGYYDAAPGAENLLGWHFNNGTDNEAAFFPAAKFRSVYYRPDVVAMVLKAKDESAAVKLTADNGAERRSVQPAKALVPPEVNILSPADRSRIEGDTVDVVVTIKNNSGEAVTSVRALVDGRPVAAGVVELPADAGQRRLRVPLPNRDVELSVIAENKYATSEPATVRILRQSTVTAEGEEFIIQPRLYIFAIGVGAYPGKDMQLSFAAKDAKDFVAALIKQKGGLYRDVAVRIITDAAATRSSMLEGLEWLQSQTTSKDVAVMFLAGHGVTDSNGIYYYLPVDADANKLKNSAVIFTEIRNTLAAIAGKALLFVDTCHSGNIMGTRRAVADINAVVNELASAEVGTVVFASSTGRQYSLEDPAWGNGAFTKALVEGLNGKADYSGKGRITINMLDLYISERVKELTDGKQTPTTAKPQTVQDFPLAMKL